MFCLTAPWQLRTLSGQKVFGLEHNSNQTFNCLAALEGCVKQAFPPNAAALTFQPEPARSVSYPSSSDVQYGALQGFYADFARVADDESRHLSWCLQRLQELGYSYGDMVAHSILWDGAQASSGELPICLS